MQVGKIKYDVIELTETRGHPLHFASGKEEFLGRCDSRGEGGVGVLVNAHLALNIDSYESLASRIGRLRLKRCGSVPALTVFVAYSPTPNYDDEEAETSLTWSWSSSTGKTTPSTRRSSATSTPIGPRMPLL